LGERWLILPVMGGSFHIFVKAIYAGGNVDKLAGNDPAGPARLLTYSVESFLLPSSIIFKVCQIYVLHNEGTSANLGPAIDHYIMVYSAVVP
jgi:hypothetical protein